MNLIDKHSKGLKIKWSRKGVILAFLALTFVVSPTASEFKSVDGNSFLLPTSSITNNITNNSNFGNTTPIAVSGLDMVSRGGYSHRQMPPREITEPESKRQVVQIEQAVEVSPVSGNPIYCPTDRSIPIYKVYKHGFEVDVPAEWQHYIREIATYYGFREDMIYGMILQESTFQPDVVDPTGQTFGLCQIDPFWIRGARINHFTEDYASRDLTNPYHNLLTMAEMWCYAREAYDIDTSTKRGMTDLLYWHGTGKFKRNVYWPYADRAYRLGQERVPYEQAQQ